MTKAVEISQCYQCPHYDSRVWHNGEYATHICYKLERELNGSLHIIPTDCPLPEWEERRQA